MQRQLLKIPLLAGKEQRVIEWIKSLDSQRELLCEVLRAEAIEVEVVALDKTSSGFDLLLFTRGPDLNISSAVFAQSTHPVDVEFKMLMAECFDLGKAQPLDVLLAWP
jgi:hypothetical protein